MIISVLLIIVGFILLIKGADFLVIGASGVAKKLKISEMVIGLTIVAMGTSMPELMVSLTSAMNGYSDISLGNVVGSNLVNVLFILGLCAIIKNLRISKESRKIDIPLSLLATILLFFLCLNGSSAKIITRPEGIILLVIFIIYILYLIKNARKIEKDEPSTPINNSNISEKENSKKFILNCAKIIVGIIALKFGADFVVNNAVNVAQVMDISERIIGVTIIAIGTSLPELVASVTAVLKNENDLAVGNIVGSNIFNILLILGVSSAISPINYSLSYNFDMVLLIAITILLAIFPFIGKEKYSLERYEGILFCLIYLAYILMLIFAV